MALTRIYKRVSYIPLYSERQVGVVLFIQLCLCIFETKQRCVSLSGEAPEHGGLQGGGPGGGVAHCHHLPEGGPGGGPAGATCSSGPLGGSPGRCGSRPAGGEDTMLALHILHRQKLQDRALAAVREIPRAGYTIGSHDSYVSDKVPDWGCVGGEVDYCCNAEAKNRLLPFHVETTFFCGKSQSH
jgi:hypothetical protein